METIADRLMCALEMSDDFKSIRGVFHAVEDGGRFDTTYSTVHRYFAGHVKEPPLLFLSVVATLFGVREAWLVTGDGPTYHVPIFSGEVEDALEERLPGILGHTQGGTREAVLFMVLELVGAEREGRVGGTDLADDQARALADVLAAPFDAFGIDQLKIDPDDFRTYVMNACLGLQALIKGDTQ